MVLRFWGQFSFQFVFLTSNATVGDKKFVVK